MNKSADITVFKQISHLEQNRFHATLNALEGEQAVCRFFYNPLPYTREKRETELCLLEHGNI